MVHYSNTIGASFYVDRRSSLWREVFVARAGDFLRRAEEFST